MRKPTTRQERKERAKKVAGAWKRCLQDEKGKLTADGRTVVNYLFRHSQFFGRQYEPGNHDATVALAAKRQLVNHILALLGLSEAAFDEQAEQALDLREGLDND